MSIILFKIKQFSAFIKKKKLTPFMPFIVLALSKGVSLKKKCNTFMTCGCLGSQNILSRKKLIVSLEI